MSYRYRGDFEEPQQYATWLSQLRERAPAGAAVLDLGCGCGAPLARDLAASGYEVTGVDFSYMLFHLPLAEQPVLLGRIARWLRPGGWLLITASRRAWTGTEDGWLGGPAPMWWSHAGAATYRDWLRHAGLQVTAEELVPDDHGRHRLLFWARRPPDRPD